MDIEVWDYRLINHFKVLAALCGHFMAVMTCHAVCSHFIAVATCPTVCSHFIAIATCHAIKYPNPKYCQCCNCICKTLQIDYAVFQVMFLLLLLIYLPSVMFPTMCSSCPLCPCSQPFQCGIEAQQLNMQHSYKCCSIFCLFASRLCTAAVMLSASCSGLSQQLNCFSTT